MDFKIPHNKSILVEDERSATPDSQGSFYRKWSSVVLPEEEIDIQELLSQYQTSVDLEIQNLKNQFSALDTQLIAQFQAIQGLQNRRIIPIQSLRSKKLRLISPLYVGIEHEDNVYVVSSEDLNLYGYGEIELNAIRDFCKEIECLYFDLKKSKNKLGKAMKENWNFLKDVVKEK